MEHSVTTAPSGTRRRRSALFVDFDNVYLGLRGLDQPLAEKFATDPASWLTNLRLGADDDGSFARRFLVRNCYLNPSTFAHYRPFWTRAGFRVVDCPSLTQRGKSGADINLVLDAVDALDHPARYDEFLIASADADFTSLVHRCRAADRFVTVITAGPVAGAYRSVADAVVELDSLAEQLGVPEAVPEETASPAVRPAKSAAAPDQSTPGVQAVRQLVLAAGGPVTGSTAAHAARNAEPELRNGWGDHSGFGAWLVAEVPDLRYASKPSPGYVWDPARFTEADLPDQPDSQLTNLQRQVVRVTDVPALTQSEYAVVLTALAEDLADQPFDRTETSKRVRDRCQTNGESIGRGAINFVIQGLLYADVQLASAPPVATLASKWADNVIGLCRGARMELSDAQRAEVQAWVSGGLGNSS